MNRPVPFRWLALAAAAGLAGGCAHRGATPPPPAVPGAVQEGIASWYGRPYHGRRTASGEVYDMYAMTAAHRTLPFGTWVRVTRRDDGRWVRVRINDRGPFVEGRIVDLSFAAAREIGLDVDGVAPVRLEVVEGPPAREERRAAPRSGGSRMAACLWVQVGAFSDHANAVRARERLEAAGERAVILEGPSGLERVRLGPFEDPREAERVRRRVLPRWPAAAVVPCG